MTGSTRDSERIIIITTKPTHVPWTGWNRPTGIVPPYGSNYVRRHRIAHDNLVDLREILSANNSVVLTQMLGRAARNAADIIYWVPVEEEVDWLREGF